MRQMSAVQPASTAVAPSGSHQQATAPTLYPKYLRVVADNFYGDSPGPTVGPFKDDGVIAKFKRGVENRLGSLQADLGISRPAIGFEEVESATRPDDLVGGTIDALFASLRGAHYSRTPEYETSNR